MMWKAHLDKNEPFNSDEWEKNILKTLQSAQHH